MGTLFESSFYLLESMTILSFAFSGMIMARKKNFDPVGMTIIAFVTALGGGTVRDLLLDNHPVSWITHSEYPVMIFLLSILYYFFVNDTWAVKWLKVLDALGLALFTVSAAHVALLQGLPVIVVAIIATCTATFGGLIRDVLCHEVPFLFQKESLYGSLSFMGSWVYMLLYSLGVEVHLATVVTVTLIFTVRLLAMKYNWRFR